MQNLLEMVEFLPLFNLFLKKVGFFRKKVGFFIYLLSKPQEFSP